MTDSSARAARRSADDFCYRHPDRQSFVLCQRCGRTVCPACQTQAPVGVICPECLAEQRGRAAASQRMHAGGRVGKLRQRLFGSDSPVTYSLLILIAVLGFAQWVIGQFAGDVLNRYAMYSPQFTDLQHYYPSGEGPVFEPWRMLTSAFLHGSTMHLAMNALTLWIFGRALEPLFGPLRFAALFVVSVLGGSLAVALLAPTATYVLGASGGVFGLFGAWFLVLRRTGQDVTSMLVLIGINVVMSFINPGISWQAHLGGLAAGIISAALTLLDLDPAGGRRRMTGLLLHIPLAALCVALPPLVATVL